MPAPELAQERAHPRRGGVERAEAYAILERVVPFQELLDDIGGIVTPGLAEPETELGEVR